MSKPILLEVGGTQLMSDYFDIILTKNSENRIDTLRMIRGITGEPLEEIKKQTDKLPVVIHTVFAEKDACQIRNRFQTIGAEVKIKGKSFDQQDGLKNIDNKSTSDDSDFKTDWKEFKKTVKITFNVLKVIAIIAVIWLLTTGEFSVIISDFLSSDFGENFIDNNPYIEMVQSLMPYDNTSYGEAFRDEFDNNEWSYFKSDGMRIVQVVSTYNDINDKMITQFLLTPQGDDQFYIEPYAVNVSGVNLSNIEKNMVIAALFKGDLSQVLLESLLYGN